MREWSGEILKSDDEFHVVQTKIQGTDNALKLRGQPSRDQDPGRVRLDTSQDLWSSLGSHRQFGDLLWVQGSEVMCPSFKA